jgi:AcrR family transcriptional regulator
MAANGSRPARGASRTVASVRVVERRGAERRGSLRARMSEEASAQVSEIQRSRLLVAAVGVVDEFGYDGVSVTRITERARVSRRTFYELFENREQCLLAVLESVIGQIEAELAGAGLERLAWRERMRSGLWVILDFFDRDPALGRLCLTQAQRGESRMLAWRQEVFERLAAAIDVGRHESARAERVGALTAHALVGGIAAVAYAHLLDDTDPRASLRDLFGELVAMIVLPYLGPEAARRERGCTPPRHGGASARDRASDAALPVRADPLAELPLRLTYRTARVLLDVCDHPGSSNRQIAERVEIHDQGQVSKLLSRLQRVGLLTNSANGAPARGDANAWLLTTSGEQVTGVIRAHSVSNTSTKPASVASSAGTPNSREGR